ncbi:XrtA-associated tyrosine autokinase [Desulfovibrio mangrovi]|uniref:XrtA-associated tyrosine autokinase n=1 Tax=Desulfovibrio mangrovi TaxID=2976983 RepID=UPI002245CE6B|nr:XrtA-associated tyrosine autokinase [Desulfovibrio mangrovi]UZP67544.1 XrtA-associated tyrosine autokinase [Desulfovibrio mangrovi]
MSRIERALERAESLQAGKTAAEGEEKPSILERAAGAASERNRTPEPMQGDSDVATPASAGAAPGRVAKHVAPRLKLSGKSTLVRQTPEIDTSKIVAAQGLYSPASEEYRKLKEQLVKLTNSKGFQNTVLVTSATVGEGKSITAVNLAVSLAMEFDHTVLLIDADIRRPTCHNYFNTAVEPGLAECLLDGVEVKDALVATGIGRLSFLPAGRPVDNPVEVLNSSLMKDFLAEIKSRYPDRYVIIDTAPVLPFAEARVLSRFVDGTLLVVRERAVSVREVQETLQALSGANVLGIVYNGATKANSPGSYYYGYHYGHKI